MDFRKVHHSIGAQSSDKLRFKPNLSPNRKSPSTGNYICPQSKIPGIAGLLAHS
jgi:hypothetical protein